MTGGKERESRSPSICGLVTDYEVKEGVMRFKVQDRKRLVPVGVGTGRG